MQDDIVQHIRKGRKIMQQASLQTAFGLTPELPRTCLHLVHLSQRSVHCVHFGRYVVSLSNAMRSVLWPVTGMRTRKR